MPQAETNDIPYNRSGGPPPVYAQTLPRRRWVNASTPGRQILLFWVIAGALLGAILLILNSKRTEDSLQPSPKVAAAQSKSEKVSKAVAKPSPSDSTSPVNYHELAHSYEKQEDREKAAEFFRKAIKSAPDDPKHRRCFGIFLTHAGRLSEGIKQLEKASELNPRDPEVFHHLGHVFLKVNDPQKSILNFDQAMELAQDNKQYSACAAKAYYTVGMKEPDRDISKGYLKKAFVLINSISCGCKTQGEMQDLKIQISKAYSEATKGTLPTM